MIDDSRSSAKIMITGAGGPAAISIMKAIMDEDFELYASDMDRHGAGLYLVPPERRCLLPAGNDPSFVPTVLEICRAWGIDVLVPTVDSELVKLAQARTDFAEIGVKLLLAGENTLVLCVDKLALLEKCRTVTSVGRFARFDSDFNPDDWTYPLILKPRSGAGSRGIEFITKPEEFAGHKRDGTLMVQEYLPGEEYSVDVLCAGSGEVIAAVPRLRMKVDSGIAVTGRTLHDAELESAARVVANAIELTYVANIQFRRNHQGTPTLLEVNPRFPGTMPLTVKSGVNMPLRSLLDVLGRNRDSSALDFEDIGVVRYWEERFVSPSEFEAVPSIITRA